MMATLIMVLAHPRGGAWFWAGHAKNLTQMPAAKPPLLAPAPGRSAGNQIGCVQHRPDHVAPQRKPGKFGISQLHHLSFDAIAIALGDGLCLRMEPEGSQVFTHRTPPCAAPHEAIPRWARTKQPVAKIGRHIFYQ